MFHMRGLKNICMLGFARHHDEFARFGDRRGFPVNRQSLSFSPYSPRYAQIKARWLIKYLTFYFRGDDFLGFVN